MAIAISSHWDNDQRRSAGLYRLSDCESSRPPVFPEATWNTRVGGTDIRLLEDVA